MSTHLKIFRIFQKAQSVYFMKTVLLLWINFLCGNVLAISFQARVFASNTSLTLKTKPPTAPLSSPQATSQTHPLQSQKFALPSLLKTIEAHYTQAKTLSADFKQVTHSLALNQDKISTGKLFLKRPSLIRWETLQPDPQLLVSNGKQFWFYTPPFDATEPGQVIQRKSSEAQSKLAQALLSGSFSLTELKNIEEINPNTFTIFPKPGSAGTVEKATLTINLKTNQIETVQLTHSQGNHSSISLSQIELGKNLQNSLFEFTPPPHTELLQQ